MVVANNIQRDSHNDMPVLQGFSALPVQGLGSPS